VRSVGTSRCAEERWAFERPVPGADGVAVSRGQEGGLGGNQWLEPRFPVQTEALEGTAVESRSIQRDDSEQRPSFGCNTGGVALMLQTCLTAEEVRHRDCIWEQSWGKARLFTGISVLSFFPALVH